MGWPDITDHLGWPDITDHLGRRDGRPRVAVVIAPFALARRIERRRPAAERGSAADLAAQLRDNT
jgi:hypothetical protein